VPALTIGLTDIGFYASSTGRNPCPAIGAGFFEYVSRSLARQRWCERLPLAQEAELCPRAIASNYAHPSPSYRRLANISFCHLVLLSIFGAQPIAVSEHL
jgi:hypothetical protein